MKRAAYISSWIAVALYGGLALFFVPALLNAIAMRGLIRRASGGKTTQEANYPVP